MEQVQRFALFSKSAVFAKAREDAEHQSTVCNSLPGSRWRPFAGVAQAVVACSAPPRVIALGRGISQVFIIVRRRLERQAVGAVASVRPWARRNFGTAYFHIFTHALNLGRRRSV